MQIRYFTKNGSVYTKTIENGREYWTSEDKDGNLCPLAGGIHIALSKLRELVREYPSTMLDQTLCFDAGVEAEFFEDAKRERFTGLIEGEATVIFFLAKRNQGHYGIGCSSVIERIESDQE